MNRSQVADFARAAARWGLCVAGVLLCAADEASDEDLEHDVLILKNGDQKRVLIATRPMELGDQSKLTFQTPGGLRIFVNRADIVRIKYREERQIEAMQRLCDSGRFEEAEALIAPLYFAMQEWPAEDTQVPWDTFRVCRLRLHVNSVERLARDGQMQAAIERIDTLREEAAFSTEAKRVLQAATERIVGEQISAALAQEDWTTARRWLDALQTRYPSSQGVLRAQRRFTAKAERLSREAQAAQRAGNTDEAKRLLRRARRIAPSHTVTRDALRELLRQNPSLTYGFIGGTTNIDPHSYYSYADYTIGRLCFRSLFRRCTETGDATHVGHVGDLAASWSIDSCNTEIEIHLDPNARWSDGTPVTARDVEYTVQLLSDPYNPARNERLTKMLEDVNVSETGQRVVVRFRVQPPALLDELCFPILPNHRPEQQLSQAGEDGYVVSGPFQPVRATDNKIVFVPNEYYAAAAPAITQLRLRFFETRAAALQALRDGNVQLLGGLTEHDVDALRGTVEGMRAGATRTQVLHCVALNDAWFRRQSEPRASRGTVASALNRGDVQSELVGGNAASGLFPPGSWAWRQEPEVILPGYDLPGARQRVTSDRDLGERPLRFVYPKSGLAAEAASRFIADLQAVGLNVRDHGLPEEAYRTRVYEEGEFEAAYVTYVFSDPFYDVSPLFRLDGRGNFMSIHNGRLTRLAQERRATISRRRICEKTDQLERFVLRELYLIPLWHSGHFFVCSQAVEGLEEQPEALFDNIEQWKLNPEME